MVSSIKLLPGVVPSVLATGREMDTRILVSQVSRPLEGIHTQLQPNSYSIDVHIKTQRKPTYYSAHTF